MTEHWGISEIAEYYGATKQLAYEWTRSGRFPKPALELAQGRVWKADDVRAWAKQYRPELRKD